MWRHRKFVDGMAFIVYFFFLSLVGFLTVQGRHLHNHNSNARSFASTCPIVLSPLSRLGKPSSPTHSTGLKKPSLACFLSWHLDRCSRHFWCSLLGQPWERRRGCGILLAQVSNRNESSSSNSDEKPKKVPSSSSSSRAKTPPRQEASSSQAQEWLRQAEAEIVSAAQSKSDERVLWQALVGNSGASSSSSDAATTSSSDAGTNMTAASNLEDKAEEIITENAAQGGGGGGGRPRRRRQQEDNQKKDSVEQELDKLRQENQDLQLLKPPPSSSSSPWYSNPQAVSLSAATTTTVLSLLLGWSVVLGGTNPPNNASFVVIGSSLCLGVLAGFLAHGNPLEQDGIGGPLARSIGRTPLKLWHLYQLMQRQVDLVSQIFSNSDETLMIVSSSQWEAWQRENQALRLEIQQRILVDKNIANFTLEQLKSIAKEQGIPVGRGTTKAQLLLKLIQLEIVYFPREEETTATTTKER